MNIYEITARIPGMKPCRKYFQDEKKAFETYQMIKIYTSGIEVELKTLPLTKNQWRKKDKIFRKKMIKKYKREGKINAEKIFGN